MHKIRRDHPYVCNSHSLCAGVGEHASGAADLDLGVECEIKILGRQNCGFQSKTGISGDGGE